jgi:cyclohexanone monooxygenase
MTTKSYDIVVVGAGFAGLYMLHKLRNRGFSVRVFEAGGDIGGTWYWNRYPGARCDVESLEYSYQFSEELQQEWEWSERYATQSEILEYAKHVVDRFALRPDIQFNTQITAMTFNEEMNNWTTITMTGEKVISRFCVMATGCLSSTNIPAIEGRENFKGNTYHTGNWPREEPNFTGQRVGIIGTGSSGVQAIPLIAEKAEHLYVFQRTPSYAIPAYNGPYDPEYVKERKANYRFYREEAKKSRSGFLLPINEEMAMSVTEDVRTSTYEQRWTRGGLTFLGAFNDLLTNKEANDTAADFIRGKIRAVVEDPAIAEKLSPQTVVGCKRLCVDTNYYQTYNRKNVSLLDVAEHPIEEITSTGIRRCGVEIELDQIIFATGFDAMTGALEKINIEGRNKQSLKDKWKEGAKTYLGVSISGFPNFFIITGPGSPSVLANMMPAIEHHVEWISDCINYCQDRNYESVEAVAEAEQKWVKQTNRLASDTLFPTCNSWYLGANIPGKPRIFMPYLGFQRYLNTCEEVVNQGYKGFSFA